MNKQTQLFLFLSFFLVAQSCKSPNVATQPATLAPTDISSFFKYTKKRPPLISAHRGGGYYLGYPENCIESFQYITDSIPAIIECDVSMTQDSILILMHDNTLDRTTTGSGPVSERFTFELAPLFLLDHQGNITGYKIPSLEQTLQWAKGKAILTLDIKQDVPIEKVVAMIREFNAEQYTMVITYNFKNSSALYQMAPEIMQSVSIGSEASLKRFRDTGIPFSQVIVFTGIKEPAPAVYKALHKAGVFCILGTLGNLDKKAATKGDALYLQFIKNGADILATDRPFEAYEAIRELIPTQSPHYFYLTK